MTRLFAALLTAVVLPGAAFAEGCPGQAAEAPATVAETVRFRLNPDVSEAAFIAAARSTMSFLCGREGFVGRSLSHDETGLWADHVLWAGRAEAMSAAEAAMKRSDMAPFMEAIDLESLESSYSEIVRLR